MRKSAVRQALDLQGGEGAGERVERPSQSVLVLASFHLWMSGLRRHQWRMNIAPLAIHFVELVCQPQPAVTEVKMCELAFRVGHGVGCPETFVCSRAEFGPGQGAPV